MKPSYKMSWAEEDVHDKWARRYLCYLRNNHGHAVRKIKRQGRRKARRIANAAMRRDDVE